MERIGFVEATAGREKRQRIAVMDVNVCGLQPVSDETARCAAVPAGLFFVDLSPVLCGD